MGSKAFDKGGAPCASCHNVASIGRLGGGRLGPDLTATYGKFGGEVGLSAWLKVPSSPTMLPIFGPGTRPLTTAEKKDLAAFLYTQASGKHPKAADTPSDVNNARVSFVALGFAGFIGILLTFKLVWRRRMKGVRKPLVQSTKLKK